MTRDQSRTGTVSERSTARGRWVATLSRSVAAIPSLSWSTGSTGGVMAVMLTGGGHTLSLCRCDRLTDRRQWYRPTTRVLSFMTGSRVSVGLSSLPPSPLAGHTPRPRSQSINVTVTQNKEILLLPWGAVAEGKGSQAGGQPVGGSVPAHGLSTGLSPGLAVGQMSPQRATASVP